jgi:hypothetical protein
MPVLGVVSVKMAADIMISDDFRQWISVTGEKQRPKYTALWHAIPEVMGFRQTGTNYTLEELRKVGQVRNGSVVLELSFICSLLFQYWCYNCQFHVVREFPS